MSRTFLSVLVGLGLTLGCAPLDDDFVNDELANEEFFDGVDLIEVPFTPSLEEFPNLPTRELAAEDEGDGVETPLPPDRGVPVAVCLERTLDFDTCADGEIIAAGDDLADLYAGYGVTITAYDYDGATEGTALAFNTSAPTGGDDDLGTPNAAFGGPGIGAGGATTNDTAMGNVMIRAENTTDRDGDGLVDDPDDHARGARFVLDFNGDVCVDQADLLDIESRERPAEFVLYDADGEEIAAYEGGGLGDNSVEQLEMRDCGVRQLVIFLRGSGAVDNIDLCVPLIELRPDPIPGRERG